MPGLLLFLSCPFFLLQGRAYRFEGEMLLCVATLAAAAHAVPCIERAKPKTSTTHISLVRRRIEPASYSFAVAGIVVVVGQGDVQAYPHLRSLWTHL